MSADPSKRLGRRVYDAWRPPEVQRATEWIPAHIEMPADCENPGPFDLGLFPHVLGVLEAGDDPNVRQIILPWATRNAKTKTSASLMICWSQNAPRPALVVGPDEETVDRTIADDYYPLLEACKLTRGQLLPEHKRNKKYIRLERSRIRRGYAGSPATLAGFPACYGHFVELSKPQKKTTEADAKNLVLQRGKLYPYESKFIFECSPGRKGECRITELVDAPTTERRRRWVPCPKCGEFQLLRLGDGRSAGGIKWQKNAAGKSEPLLAEATAWYECEHCRGRIQNHERFKMMRAGVWLSEGQTIDKHRNVHGEPRLTSPNVAFAPLGSWYSLAIGGWGQIAKDWLDAVARGEEGRRDFQNGTAGEVYDPTPASLDAGDVAARICVPDRLGVVPKWGIFLTAAVDCQDEGRRFPWVVCAWGPGGRGAVVDHGEFTSLDDVDELLQREFPHADGGLALRIQLAGVDSGFETDAIYDFCRPRRRVLAIKGLNRPIPTDCRLVKLDETRIRLLEVNTDTTNDWLQQFLDGRKTKDEPGFFSLPAEVGIDFAFVDELLNEIPIKGTDKKGKPTRAWHRRTRGQPNDKRDCVRYARALAQLVTRHGSKWDTLPPRPPVVATTGLPPAPALKPREEPTESFIRRPAAGQSWIRR